MAKAKKLPSGNWNIQVFDFKDASGKIYRKSFTAPTKAKAELLAAQFMEQKPRRRRVIDMTVADAIARYIELSAVLSPSTTNGYKHALTDGFADIMNTRVYALTDMRMQEAINKEARRQVRGHQISAKTVRNEYGLISAALKTVCGVTFTVKLPTYQPHKKQFPPVSAVLQAIKDTDIELPCLLAIWRSLRASEVRGLMYSDIHGDIITINRVVVDAGGPVVKPYAKTDASLRSFPVPPYMRKLIIEDARYMEYLISGKDDYICPMSHTALYYRWNRICQQNGFEITFHDLRHMNASILLNVLRMPEKVVQEQGGWKTPHIMKSVYSFASDETMLAMYAEFDSYMTRNMI